MSFFEFSERGVPQARQYLDRLSADTGREVRPRLSFGWLFLRATRLPFLTATFVPVLLGIAVAAWADGFSWWLALLTVIGGACIHLGLNVANDVFDTHSGADEANVNPTQFSGGSRVILYGLVSMRQMALLSLAFYAVGIGIGVFLAATSGWGLLWIGVAGALISLFYTAPPLQLVHRGLGEICVGLGFGPIMALGAYFVQTGALRPRAAARLDPRRDPDRADPVRERGPGPAGRRGRRQAHAAGAALEGGGHPRLCRRRRRHLRADRRLRDLRPARAADADRARRRSARPPVLRALRESYDSPTR